MTTLRDRMFVISLYYKNYIVEQYTVLYINIWQITFFSLFCRLKETKKTSFYLNVDCYYAFFVIFSLMKAFQTNMGWIWWCLHLWFSLVVLKACAKFSKGTMCKISKAVTI